MELCTLPTEIQHLIVLNLHPSAAIALRQTNRWFHTHVSLHRLDRIAVQDYLHHLESQPKSQRHHQYSCFSCLCLKPHTAFTSIELDVSRGWNRSYYSHRFCLDCGVRDGKFKPFTVLYVGEDYSRPRVFCGACLCVQAYFCNSCHCCSGCLARAGTWTGRAALWQQTGRERLCQKHFR